MKEFGGWQFPDDEDHLIEWMRKADTLIDGRLAYQAAKIDLALRHVSRFRCAVDVGSHVGLWSFYLAKRFARVEAFEPVPEHGDCFALNVTAPTVTLHRCALGAADGEVRIAQFPGNSGHTHVSAYGTIVAPMRTLDSFAFDDVDFLKIDCEGYEREVLRGAVDTITRCRPTIIVEQKPGNGSRYGHGDRGALKLLAGMGVRIVAEKSGDYVLTW